MFVGLSAHFLLPILFATGLVAGTVDAIAGGGGLISLPMLLGVGVPPHIALGTNKFQASIGTFIATYSYYRHGWFSLKTIYKGLLFGLIGAVLGAVVGQVLDSNILKKIIPILLLIILMYTIFSPKLGVVDKKPKLNEFWFYVFFGFVLGFYDGFFGPGTGSLWLFSLTFFLGYHFTKATAYTKMFNLKSNLIATACFVFGHNVDYRIAICMALGQIIGARLGAHLTIKKGAKLIRPVFISVVSVTIVTLTIKSYFSQDKLIQLMNSFGLLEIVIISIIAIVGIAAFYFWNIRRLANIESSTAAQ